VLDTYFPGCSFFTEFERFERHCYKIQDKIDYVSICSPNYLHDSHCRFALRIGADAICEKPLVCHERNLDGLRELEKETGSRVWAILQLRLKIDSEMTNVSSGHDQVQINYSTPRGKWFRYSWKGNVEKSGGLATNIGIHLFDLVVCLFGRCEEVKVDYSDGEVIAGRLFLKSTCVKWRLSICQDEEPQRVLEINGRKFELSNGFAELHTRSYEKILVGDGFGIESTREAIRICEKIRKL
jgi:UDP-N-acetyl-2-amino-2-deoxyglucuronate dehydrogenase